MKTREEGYADPWEFRREESPKADLMRGPNINLAELLNMAS